MAEEFTRQLYAKRVGTTRTSRFRLIEKSRIGEIVASVRRIGAAPAQTKMLAIAPDIFIRGYLHHTRHTDERNRDLSDRANRHYASAARPQRFASRQGYDYTGETHFSIGWLFDFAKRFKAYDPPAAFGSAMSSRPNGSLQRYRATTRSIEVRNPVGLIRLRAGRVGVMPIPNATSFEKPSKNSPTTVFVVQGYSLNDGLTTMAAARDAYARRAKFASERARPFTRQFSHIWKGLNSKVGAFQQMRRDEPSFFGKAASGIGVAVHGHSTSGFADGISRAAGFAASTNRRVRPHASSINAGFADPHSERGHSYPNGALGALSKGLPKAIPAAGLIAQLRAQRPALGPPALAQPATLAIRAARSRAVSGELPHPIVVNFSPTVVIQGGAELGNIEHTVVQAIRRHSHELVRIVSRELQTQRRAAF